MDYLVERYPQQLLDCFKIDQLEQQTLDTLEAIGRKRGCLVSGGRVDLDKVCKILINEFRTAKLGAISLETPDMIERELIEVAEKIRLKEEKKAARKKKFKKK